MPIDIYIRPAIESDAIMIAKLSEQLGYSISAEETLQNLREILSDKEHTAFVACINSIIVGWIHIFRTIRVESMPFAEIGGLVIAEDYRKQGIGKLLVNKAREWTKEKHIGKLRVRCNRKRTEAHQFYGALGFIESKEQKVFETAI